MKRWLASAAVGLLSTLCFVRSAAWGWPQLDDVKWLQTNPHVGASWGNALWALTATAPGHRWMPVAWLVWDVVPASCQWWHVLALAAGGLMVAAFVRLAADFMPLAVAMAVGLLFGCSPLRAELFTWGMGCEYEAMMFFVLLAWVCRESSWCVVLAALSLLSYPASAGMVMLLAWYVSGERRAWALCAVVAIVAAVEIVVGVGGLHEWHPGRALLVLPHVMLMQVFPFAVSPLFPPVMYSGIYVGAAMVGLWCAGDWRAVVAGAVVMGPVMLASAREPFWLGARYSVLFAVPFLVWLGARLPQRVSVAVALALCAGVWAWRSSRTVVYRSLGDCLRETQAQAALVGVATDPAWVKIEGRGRG